MLRVNCDCVDSPNIREEAHGHEHPDGGRIAMVAASAKRWWAPSSRPNTVKCALGNNDDKLSLSSIIYSTQDACRENK
ncbi:hypothetical protein KSS87_002562 [Heliosperma pusillum]|nr:hypothetical protein KSS87_002562 [Heliosperma pusillum]